MKKIVFGFLILVLGVFLGIFKLQAENITISYVDGTLEIKTKNGWNKVFIGDSIPSDAILRLKNDSIAQLEGNGVSLTLSSPGSYNLRRLLEEKQKMRSWDIASLVENKIFGVLSSTRRPKATAAMGIRGAKAKDTADVEWAEDNDNYISEAKNFIEKGEYDRAIQVLQEGLRSADEDTKAQYFYFLGFANMQNGRPYIALKYFNRIKPDPYFEYFDGYVVLRGKLLVDSFAFKEANKLFDFYLKEMPRGNIAQTVYFLKGIALKNLGDIAGAKSALEKAYTLNPSTEIGRKAQEILTSNF